MPRTFADYQNLAEHAAGGQIDGSIDLGALVNDAGRYLVHMHEWGFLERPRALLATVSGQAYLALPADFGKLIAAGNTADFEQYGVELVTLDRLHVIRSSQVYDPTFTFIAIEWPGQSSTTVNAGAPRLAIHPTPSSSTADRFWVNYYAGWTELTAGSAVPDLPAAMEPLLVALIRAFARGEAAGTGPSEELETLERAAWVRRLKQSYGLASPETAPMRGGIGARPYSGETRRVSSITYP